MGSASVMIFAPFSPTVLMSSGMASIKNVTMLPINVKRVSMRRGRFSTIPLTTAVRISMPHSRRVMRVSGFVSSLTIMLMISMIVRMTSLAFSLNPFANSVINWTPTFNRIGRRVGTNFKMICPSAVKIFVSPCAMTLMFFCIASIIFGNALTMASARPTTALMRIGIRVSIRDGNCCAMTSKNSGNAPIRDSAMPPTVFNTVGSFSLKLLAKSSMPCLILPIPLSSPENNAVSPSMTVVRDGRNSPIRLFFAPVRDVLRFWRLS